MANYLNRLSIFEIATAFEDKKTAMHPNKTSMRKYTIN